MLTSVHAFATDPARGVFILIFLCIVIGGSLLLYAIRATNITSIGKFNLFSRETLLLLNNIILVVACATVLFGTLYPLLYDALYNEKLSVGPPYFNTVFVPLMIPILILSAIGPLTRWKRDTAARLSRELTGVLILSVMAGVIFYFWLGDISWAVAAMIAIFTWMITATLLNIYKQVRNKSNKLAGLKTISRSYYGMSIAHVGLAVFALGVTFTSSYSIEHDIRMKPGDTHQLADYSLQFKGAKEVKGPNYQAQEGYFEVSRDGQIFTELKPQKRLYIVQRSPMTEAAIDAGLMRDLFVAMGEPLDNGEWSMRLQYKPLIRWIWLGTLIMAFGGILALTDRRYRIKKQSQASHA